MKYVTYEIGNGINLICNTVYCAILCLYIYGNITYNTRYR